MKSRSLFERFAKWTSRAAGDPRAFGIAVLVILAWFVTGPVFGFSDRWQLAINSTTTIATFLMVFLIQNTQNREIVATQVKLDEIIRSIEGAHLALLDLEELTESDLDRIRARYEELARKAREELRKGHPDTGRPRVKVD